MKWVGLEKNQNVNKTQLVRRSAEPVAQRMCRDKRAC